MTERYLITGTQIGMLKAFINQDLRADAIAVLNEIFDSQFVGNSKKNVKSDTKAISQFLALLMRHE